MEIRSEEHTRLLWAQIFPPDGRVEKDCAAIIDTAKWPGLFKELEETEEEWLVLHQGQATQELMHVLPCLVLLKRESCFVNSFLQRFGLRVGIIVRFVPPQSSYGRPDITGFAGHACASLHVRLPDKEWAWFRWYDPAVLSDFWQIASSRQKRCLMGSEVDEFLVEDPVSNAFASLTCGERDDGLPEERPPLEFTCGQVAHFDARHHHRFLEKAFCRVAPLFPNVSSKDVRHHVQESVSTAEGYGLQNYDDLLEYVELDARAQWNFSTQENVWRIMSDASHSPTARLLQLRREIDSQSE